MPLLTNSEVSFAKTTLAYPVYAAEFDPYDRGYLIVGGGGGEGRSGVPNQISVLDVSNRASILTAVEIDLSRDEDSVSSLSSLATKDGLITFAGLNSSQANQDAGNNEHFRAFSIRYPPRKRQKTQTEVETEAEKLLQGQIELLGKRSLFRTPAGPKKETYQRLLRLSPARRQDTGTKRIGAIAAGLARESEIIAFDATVSIPDSSHIINRINLPVGNEAADLDIALTEESEFSLAYCDDYNIYEQTFAYDFDTKKAEKRPSNPRRVHQMPFPDAFEDPKARPKFRCLRFLNSENILALVNKPNKGGAELRVYHLYPTGPSILIRQMKLPYHVRQASSLDVCILDTDADGNHQVVIAIAGQDISIEIYTTNFQADTDTFSPFKNYNTFKRVHQQQMTKLCFSTFHSPIRAPTPGEAEAAAAVDATATPEKQVPAHPGPQYIKLASVSYGNTVVVDTFPLSPLQPKDKLSRYVLSHPSDETFWKVTYVAVFSFMVLVTAFLLQAFVSGFAGTEVGPVAMLPQGVKQYFDLPAGYVLTRTEITQITRITQLKQEIHVSTATKESWDIPAGTPSEAALEIPPNSQTNLEPEVPLRDSSTTFPHEFHPGMSTEEMPGTVAEPVPLETSNHPGLREALSAHSGDVSEADIDRQGTVIVHDVSEDEGLTYAVHPDKQTYLAQNPEAKHWHELEEHQKAYWKKKLIAAGQWAEHETEAVLKGILWSTYAGFVGQAAGEILREL